MLRTRPPRKQAEAHPARLACSRHAASVDPEPGSNSPPSERFRVRAPSRGPRVRKPALCVNGRTIYFCWLACTTPPPTTQPRKVGFPANAPRASSSAHDVKPPDRYPIRPLPVMPACQGSAPALDANEPSRFERICTQSPRAARLTRGSLPVPEPAEPTLSHTCLSRKWISGWASASPALCRLRCIRFPGPRQAIRSASGNCITVPQDICYVKRFAGRPFLEAAPAAP